MTAINKKRVSTGPQVATSHENFMGGPSFFVNDPVNQLRLAAASSFFGEVQYYRMENDTVPKVDSLSPDQLKNLRSTLQATDDPSWASKSPRQVIEDAIDAALDFDPERTLQLAVDLRTDDHIRVTPQVILVRAANHPKVVGPKAPPPGEKPPVSLIGKYAPLILRRADDAVDQLAYQFWVYGDPIPNSLKRAWATYLKCLNSYQVAKYRKQGREVRLADVVAISHANNGTKRVRRIGGKSVVLSTFTTEPGPIDLLMNDQARSKGSTKTWESVISGSGSSTESWTEAVEIMGHQALVRNVRNLIVKGVPQELFVEKLIGGAAKGQLLPFQYFSAYKSVQSLATPTILDALDDAMRASMPMLGTLSGRTMSLCDNSGSAQRTTQSTLGTMKISSIANLTGVLTGMVAQDGYVGVFGDKLRIVPVRKRDSVFTQATCLDKIGHEVGESTENGIWLFWNQAILDKEHWDHVFVYSDMQAGHGGLYGLNPLEYKDFAWDGMSHYIDQYIDVGKLVARYRKNVNPNVMVYFVQVAGYTDTIIPEFYNRMFILSGWSEGVIQFAVKMDQIYNELAKR